MQSFNFLESLKQLEKNLNEAIGAFYVYDSIVKKAWENKAFLNQVNENKYFWKSILYSLQSTYFISLGRLFDNSSATLSINAFISKCLSNIHIFSKSELKKRRLKDFSNEIELDNYIANTIEPSKQELGSIQKIIKSYNEEYQLIYKDIRNKVFGHSEITTKQELDNLFSKTSRDKLDEIFTMLTHLFSEFYNLYHNGHKLKLSNKPYIQKNSFIKKTVEDSEKMLNKLNAL